MRSIKTIGTDGWLLRGLSALLILLWLIDFVVRMLPAPLPTRWSREIIEQLYLASSVDALWRRPWTIVTYTLLHNSGLHLLLNLLLLWFFGKMLLRLSTWRQFVWSYLWGAIVGGGAFILYSSLLRAGGWAPLGLPLVGASASVIALVGYMIGYAPRQETPLSLIGSLQVWQVGLLVLLLLLLAYGGYNIGGLVAHLAGLVWGYLFGLYSACRAKRYRQHYNEEQVALYHHLVDKVQRSGYQSLSEEERELLIAQHKQTRDVTNLKD